MNLPFDFIEQTRQLMGAEACNELCEALTRETPVSIRMNNDKCPLHPLHATPVAWSKGWYLDYRPTFTFDPLFHAGCYYVQEASSMFVEQALRQYVHEPVVMLDLCAAPGGKSTLARSVLPEGSLLVANEVIRNRSQVLAENLIKWGHPSVVVTNNDPADFAELGGVFDVILTDVPCSGEGMFRKDETAVSEWSLENVNICWQRQRRILQAIWGCLKPNGILIYSTCTFNREENEDNVAWIARELGAEVLPIETDAAWNISGNLTGGEFPVYRFLPHRTEGEGLFLAVLRKTCEDSYEPASKRNKKNKPIDKKQTVAYPKAVTEWIADHKQYEFSAENGTITAFPATWKDLYMRMKQTLRVIHAGITLAEQKGKDWQPSHSLAMSTQLAPQVFPLADLTYEQAIAYLRKEAITLDASIPKGYVILTYQNHPLGFAKNIGNRANNLYPQEWRIRSGYMPEEVKTLLF